MIQDISLSGLNGLRGQEGRALRAYQDIVHVWTIGYGLTNADKGLPFKIGPGVTITEQQAEWLLLWTLRKNYQPDVLAAFGDQQGLANPQGAIDAGDDMHYNTGGIKRSSWPRLLKEGNLSAAKANLESWNRAGGRVVADLVRRRAWEWGVTQGVYGHETGPTIVVPDASGRETFHGSASLLTAFPTDPAAASPLVPALAPGSVKSTGVPIHETPAPGALHEGDTGPEVVDVQNGLTAAGIPTVPTGTMDDATIAALKKFQGAHPQLTVDGIVGPATRAALARAAALRGKAAQLGRISIGLPAATAGLWHYAYTNAAEIALIAGGIGLAVALLVLAIKYRQELVQIGNKAIGRSVS